MKTINIEDESPYCDVCGTCGYIGCCGIRNFISEHIEGKTNCKNEDLIISELINLCDYKDKVFEENEQYKNIITRAIEYIGNGNIGIPRKTRDKFIAILEGEDKDANTTN